MQQNPEHVEEFRKVISQNALQGNSFYIKFTDDPNYYMGIPILRSTLSRENENIFDINVFEHVEKKGVMHKSLEQIEFLEQR